MDNRKTLYHHTAGYCKLPGPPWAGEVLMMAAQLARGYRIAPFFTLYLSDEPRGAFDRYICTTPTFFI